VLPPDFVERHTGQRRWASLRPEKIEIGQGGQGVQGVVRTRIFLGATNRLSVDSEGARLHVVVPAAKAVPAEGSSIALSWAPADLHLMDEPA